MPVPPASFRPPIVLAMVLLWATSLPSDAAQSEELAAANQKIRELTAKTDDLTARLDSLAKQFDTLRRQQAAAAPAAKTPKAAPPAKSDQGTPTTGPSANPDLADYAKSSTLTIKEASDAFAVPDSPAAAALGVSPAKVQHVTTPKQLIPTVINGLDDRGNFQSGFAIDFAPGQMLLGHHPLSDFQHGDNLFSELALAEYLQRLALRTQISFASIRGTDDADKSTKIALGLHTVLLAANDPVLKGVTPVDRFAPERLPLNRWVKDSLNDEVGAFNWFVSRLSSSVGAAPTWISTDGHRDDYRYDGTTVWGTLTFRPPASKDLQDTSWRVLLTSTHLSLNAIYHNDEQISASYALHKPARALSPSAMISQDSLFVVAGLEFGTHSNHAVLTGALVELSQHGLGDDTAFRYGITVEHQIPATNTWLTLSVSQDSGHKNGENPTLLLGGVKLGLGGNDFYARDKAAKQNAIKSLP